MISCPATGDRYFNGAALTGARRGACRFPSARLNCPLQRGRAHGSAEGDAELLVSWQNVELQRGRAHGSAEGVQQQRRACRRVATSTGPRSRERGGEDIFWSKSVTDLLQRGRAHGSAEGT